ncbi:MAG: NADH-quinone oxidoreductase subunit B, partial [Chloroflexi bacterium]|nr:NADH-quinone oxidoreductase subunit B [Chloroflexota bacterium]
LLHGLITLQKKIDRESIKSVRWYRKEAIDAIPIPVLGPDLMDPREYDRIKQYAQEKLAKQESAESEPAVEEA